MDTPEKIQIETPLFKSKFEDSPVFSYINSLSPIKPVKSSIHITQPFNSLGFSSLPSVFTSPHVSFHKESRFFKIHNSPNSSKPESLSEHGNKSSVEFAAAENFDPKASTAEASVEPPNENFEAGLPQILRHDCGSPGCDSTTWVTDTGGESERGVSTMTVTSVQGGGKGSSEVGPNLQKMCNIHAKDETPDWESLISDAAELFIFCSPKDSEAFTGLIQKKSDPETGLCTSYMSQSNQNESDLHLSNLHRGMRRRCLDFEMLGARRKNLGEGSNSSSSIDKRSISNKPGLDSSLCVLPGIGLHLNALAMSAKDGRNTNAMHETSHSGKIQINFPGSNASLERNQEPLTSDMAIAETESAEDGAQTSEDASKVGAELNPGSPKKKRCKSEQSGEGEACKRCNCKKSKCLKLYCECFAAGVYCIEPCSCLDCFNKPIHEDTVLATRKQIESRNPLAFAPKVIRSSEAVSDIGDDSTKTPASARHKRGCNCKKSNCLKKYCECYQGGVGCSINCRCEGCKNAFGRKDGTLIGTEGEPDEENETSDKSEMTKAIPTSDFRNEEQNPSSAIPMTPTPLYRPLVQPPFSSKTRPPQSSLGAGSSSSSLYNTQKDGIHNIVPSQSRLNKNFESITGDEMEMPEILVRSPMATIKTASPNSKRVTSPHFDSSGSLTPGRRSGRKLILQSIPSFPSLTPQH